MNVIEVALERKAYPVYLGQGLLGDADLWRRHLGPGKTLIVSNDVVGPLYLQELRGGLAGIDHEVHIIADGEPMKTVETWYGIIDALIGIQARRVANIIALGGGVVVDISGFAAASYMRGIRFLQAPTTLLAQVDASVGGKTAINHARGKNLVGAFHQPACVVIDTGTLATLREREFNAGLAEVVKYGAIRDAEFFDWLEAHAEDINARDPAAMTYLIGRSVETKAGLVAEDEREAGVRALLNFGHSFGHALEAETGYRDFLHGEAVAIVMVIASRLSESRSLCEAGTAARISRLLSRFRLPVALPTNTSIDGLCSALNLDKKAVVGGLRLILLHGIGRAVIDPDSSQEEIVTALKRSLSTP
jgi:3-dehydroquinate synthase